MPRENVLPYIVTEGPQYFICLCDPDTREHVKRPIDLAGIRRLCAETSNIIWKEGDKK
jgi:hypothetical protein